MAAPELRPARALALLHTVEPRRQQQTCYFELARQIRLRMKSYEWEAILHLKQVRCGETRLSYYLGKPGLCFGCMNARQAVDTCRRQSCTQQQCAQLLCPDCRTEDLLCRSPNFCTRRFSRRRAAIRELHDHWIGEHWLELARMSNVCAEHVRGSQRPRPDDKPSATPAKPKQSNTCQITA